MNKHQEKVLVAGLAGLIIAGAAAFAVQPANAAGYSVDGQAQITAVAPWDSLDLGKWPALKGQEVGSFVPDVGVSIERGAQKGWVDSLKHAHNTGI